MKIEVEFSPNLRLNEGERATLWNRFKFLIEVGELTAGRFNEYALEHEGQLYVLAPHHLDQEKFDAGVYLLCNANEWDV